MASITRSLHERPHCTTQDIIAESFWGSSGSIMSSKAYWAFYTRQCHSALHDSGIPVKARTHADILDIAGLLMAGTPRHEIRESVRLKFPEQHKDELEALDNSINLAASLLLMIHIGDLENEHTGKQWLDWENGSLSARLEAYFGVSPALDHERTKLPRLFNVRGLRDIAGISVLPTDNLLDHLRLTHDDTRLLVFHHVSFLKRQSESSMLPSSLVEETLDTLALLFPRDDRGTAEWYTRASTEHTIDSLMRKCERLKTDDRRIEKFQHWHDRLVVLKQVVDEATPQTMSQFWHDSRNGVQWCTFWIAILVLLLTFVFGLIQSGLSGLQYAATVRNG